MYEVYLIINQVNQMKYIGITCKGAHVRFEQHLANAIQGNSRAPLHEAIREFGRESFTLSVLECDIPQDDARQRELYYIEQYHCSEPDGYNTYRRGMGGIRHSEEAKKNISEGLRGHIWSNTRNQHVRDAMTGRDYKQEWSNNLSKSRLGRYKSENNPFFGKHHSPEVLAKIKATKLDHPDHRVECLNESNETVCRFNNFAEAGRWVVSHGLADTSTQRCAERISSLCRQSSRKLVYGFIWRFQEGQSTNQ